jgi:GH24 family phage-related lysozyme (muramidase)
MGTLSGTWIGNNKYDSEIYNHINYKPVITDGKESINTNLVFMCFTIGTNNSERSKVYNYFNDKNWVTNLCQHKTGK